MTKPTLISVLCGSTVMLKIFAESPNSTNTSSLVNELKNLNEIPPLQKIYNRALALGVGTEKNLIVLNKEEECIYKGPGVIDPMCIHNFQKAKSNPYALNTASEYYRIDIPLPSN